ncbi:hypothetical protein, partial [Streptomyces sp. FH025]|uniref:hypothetical protein n=1 Tax=Streptomyces sp. FH025 TaxID=2815937 RepID=UPI001AC76A17
MADGTKAVVDTSAADASANEAALAAAIDELEGGKTAPAGAVDAPSADASTADGQDAPAEPDEEDSPGEETSEITAPLSAREIAAELAAGSGSPRKKAA